MRLHLKTTPSQATVPFNYQENLAGALYKWLGDPEEIHQEISLYSFSWLKGGKGSKGGLIFPEGAFWNISAVDKDLLDRLIHGISQTPSLAYGMEVKEIQIEQEPEFRPEGRFLVQSPVLVKRQEENGHERFYTFDEPAADDLLTETLHHKLQKADRGDLQVEVAFDRSYRGAKTKVTTYKGIHIKGSVCPVYMKGDPEALAFAWNVGVGNSTGIGFGSLK
jgi:CRISPR-associated endoribonuclease Cas6